MAGVGHENAFPPTTLSNRFRLAKPTFAGTRGNEQDAPLPDTRQPRPALSGDQTRAGCGGRKPARKVVRALR